MWTLVRKDLILDRRMIGLSLALYLVMGPVFMSLTREIPVTFIAGWAGLVGAMTPLSLVAREDKFETATLTCSLPVTRDGIVASRFAGAWLLSLSGGLAVLTVCYVAARAGLAQGVGGWGEGLLVAVVTIGLILAGLIPFTMRFGFAGLIGLLVALQVLGIVAFLSLVLLGGHGGGPGGDPGRGGSGAGTGGAARPRRL
jgi:ABC-type transport system involved in multi-copper enzyme maturation permease subunit